MKYPSGESFDQAAHETRIAVHFVYRRLVIDKLIIMVAAPCIPRKSRGSEQSILRVRRKEEE